MMKKLLLLTLLFLGIFNLSSQSKKELQVSLIRVQQENEILRAQIADLKNQLAESDNKYSLVSSENKSLKDQVAASKQSPTLSSSDNRSGVKSTDSHSTTTTTQCQGTTANGSQCSRNASTGSDFCWQHQEKKVSDSQTKAASSTSGSSSGGGRTIYTGPRGGRYYINSSGKKVYVK